MAHVTEEEMSPQRATRRAGSSGPARWSRTIINFALDAAMLGVFVALSAVSVVVRFVFPPGTVADAYTIWGLTYDAWAAAQFWLLALLALAVLVHVMLHWNWVCNVVASRMRRSGPAVGEKKGKLDDGIMTLYGVGLLIVVFGLIGLVVGAAALSVRG